jgi:hypothetical protein
MRQRLERVGKTALTVGICTLFAWILVFASSTKRPSADYPTAISTEAETRYVGEVRAFILDLLFDMTGLSFLAAFGCRIAIGALYKKKPRGTHDE